MTVHWTQYLPEGKRIFSAEVQRIRLLEEQIENVKAELKLLEREYSIKEYELGQLVIEKGYSGTEIDKALDEWAETINVNNRE